MISVKKIVFVPYEEPEDVTNNSGLSNEIIVYSLNILLVLQDLQSSIRNFKKMGYFPLD